jgi:hypothetical protein
VAVLATVSLRGAAVAGLFALGPRIGKFSDGNVNPIPGHNIASAPYSDVGAGVWILTAATMLGCALAAAGRTRGRAVHAYATAPRYRPERIRV